MSGFSSFLNSTPGGAAIEGLGGVASGLISLLGPNPYKQQFKWSEKGRKAKIADVQSLMKPNAPWFSMSKNMPAVNDALNSQVMRGMNLYRGGPTGTGVSYPWMKG